MMNTKNSVFYFPYTAELGDTDKDPYEELAGSRTALERISAMYHSPHYIMDFHRQEALYYHDSQGTIYRDTKLAEDLLTMNILPDTDDLPRLQQCQDRCWQHLQTLGNQIAEKSTIINSFKIRSYEFMGKPALAAIKIHPLMISEKGKTILAVNTIEAPYLPEYEIQVIYSPLNHMVYTLREGEWIEESIEMTEKEKRMIRFASIGIGYKELASMFSCTEDSVKYCIGKYKKKFSQDSPKKLFHLFKLMEII